MDEAGNSHNQSIQCIRQALEIKDSTCVENCLNSLICQSPELTKEILKNNLDIVFKICKLGFVDALQTILGIQAIDINDQLDSKTMLQVACKKGQSEIVKILLKHKAEVKSEVWDENSEFYLATYNGHLNIINILLNKFHDHIQERSISYCLFYAACCSGKLDVVQKWYYPNMNLNNPIEFVPTLTGCEILYPLYASCQARNSEVAFFLIDNGASVTKEICKQFPEFSTHLIQTKFQTSNLRGKRDYDLSERAFQSVHPQWFLTHNDNIQDESDVTVEVEIKINLSKNLITDLPGGVLWENQRLTVLKVCNNPLKTIADPLNPSAIQNNSITQLDLSYCNLNEVSHYIFDLPCLKELDLSHNQLSLLGNEQNSNQSWKCTGLISLNISNNKITHIPSGIKNCSVMKQLYAHHNCLDQAFPPWQCPMRVIELSHNKLTSFCPSADQFWGRTLQILKLDNNLLDELTESIVKMSKLDRLDVSYNLIKKLPPRVIWSCQLSTFYINNNQLGMTSQRTPLQRNVSLNVDPAYRFDFPGSVLKNCLVELSLADNKLKAVPPGVCCLENLCILDLSGNTEISVLPEELGTLKNLAILKLKGITLKNKQLQAWIANDNDMNTAEIISYLERELKKSVPHNVQKMVILGCQKFNGQCFVEKLISGRGTFEGKGSLDHQNMTISTWELTLNKSFFDNFLPQTQRRSLTFNIWEFPENRDTLAVLPCFLTLNSLYIIVHDVITSGTLLHSVSEKIAVIQSCVNRPEIIVACLCPHNIDAQSLEKALKEEALRERLRCSFALVNLEDSQTLVNLNQKIYEASEKIKDSPIEKWVPAEFVETAKKALAARNNINICSFDDFLSTVKCSKQSLNESLIKGLKMHEYLLQVGAMLHYNIYRDELSQCVFLNPSWLYETLKIFFKSLKDGKKTQMSIEEVKKIVASNLSEEFFIPFLHLLEAFNIGIRIVDSFKNEVLIIPSLLPEQPPQIQLDPYSGGYRAFRLYCVSAIPSAFWSQVIVQLITAFERFSSSKWKMGSPLMQSAQDYTKSFKMGCRASLKGLQISNKNIQYWRTGIMINHDLGYLVVEEVECFSSLSEEKGCPSILVTVQTTDSDSHRGKLKKLSIIGIVRDELEEILDIFFPKFHDPTEIEMKPYALCPLCCKNIQPFSGKVIIPDIHYCVRDCAQMIMWTENITCSCGPTSLDILVPEFFFFELPEELRLESEHLELLGDKLGQGIAGLVHKGKYKGEDVAVKLFHTPEVKPLTLNAENPLYINVLPKNNCPSDKLLDENDTEQRKISSAFCDVRKEVNVLSKLRHKCIVEFLGVCVKPKLLLVMELAPLGSLRSALKSDYDYNPEDKIISKTVFSKDLTYKIILQIAHGLAYLHSCKIIYRDLKPDNILLMSLDVASPINVKLSDYGISKFASVQGTIGLFGTPGYMAPEVMTKQNYTTKVDIYSLAIVMLEILTGISPLSKKQRPLVSQISQMLKENVVPPQINGCTLQCNFPYLERLIPECWSLKIEERPTADEIIKQLRHDQFLLLHDSLWFKDKRQKLKVSCVYACETAGRWNIWIAEYEPPDVRKFSVYDVESSNFIVYRWHSIGKKVLAMAKVGLKIWLACKDLKHIEIIGRGNQSKMEVSHGQNLESEPSQMINHKFGPSEGSECFVLIGFENGSLTAIYNSCPLQKSSIVTMQSFLLRENVPVTHICSVTVNTIAIACGAKVYFLEVKPQECKNKQIVQSEIAKGGFLCLQSLLKLEIYAPIAAMATNSETIWCCLENTALLIRINVKFKNVELVLSLYWNSIRDIAVLKQMSEEFLGKVKEHWTENETDSCLLENAAGTEARRSANEKTSLCAIHSESDSSEDERDKRPSLPPKANYCPSSDAPPIAAKPTDKEEQLFATSLIVSSDVLVVGTNTGALFHLPVNSFPNKVLSLTFPLLHHPIIKAESRARSGTSRSCNSMQIDMAKSISSLLLVHQKLFSLFTIPEKVELRRSVPRNSDKSKRLASILTDQDNSSSSDSVFIELDSGLGNLDKASSSPYLTSSCQEEENENCGVADIAIWDEISQERLSIMRGFIQSLS